MLILILALIFIVKLYYNKYNSKFNKNIIKEDVIIFFVIF